MKFLDFYNYHLKHPNQVGIVPEEPGCCGGLCNCRDIENSPEFALVRAGEEDKAQLSQEGLDSVFWASDMPKIEESSKVTDEHKYGFGPLRQTLILFCAALNGEL